MNSPSHLQSELLSSVIGIRHAFGTRLEPFPTQIFPDWDSIRPTWKQVHGVRSFRVTKKNDQCGEVDALWTSTPGIPIAVVSADCVPILLARKDGTMIGAVHAGWRGTKAQILPCFFDSLPEDVANPSEWVAAIGPAIGPCCYEVSPELADEFAEQFEWMSELGMSPVLRKRYLDLPAINAAELEDIGIAEVETIRACTRCACAHGDIHPLFHSYRREGGGTRQFSAIMIETPEESP